MKTLKKEDGIALLITIAVITLVVAVALELNQKARLTAAAAAATRNRVTLASMATSGVNIAMAVLVKDRYESKADSIQEDWANPDKMSEILQGFPFEDGNVTVKITDELSRIQVNAIVKFPDQNEPNNPQMFLWDRFLTGFISEDDALEEIEPGTIVASLKDWIDAQDDDAVTGLNGAESDYYESLDTPYSCRNGRIPHTGELILVKGMTQDLFYGSAERPGISEYLTADGMTRSGVKQGAFEGKVNINTAEIPVLGALLPVGHGALSELLYTYRSEKTESTYLHDLTDPEWYKDIPGMGGIEIDPDLITTSSDIFRIESTASLFNSEVTITSVVEREKDSRTGEWKCKILRWKID